MRQAFVRARTLSAALSFALLVAACGGGGGDSATAPQSSAPPPPAATNTAPTITGSPGTAVRVGEAYSFKPSASDANGDTLTFSVTNKPAWLAFNASTGELTGTPTDSNVGNFSGITVSVSDGKATVSLAAFALGVTQIAVGSATVNWGAPTANSDGSALTNLAGYKVLYGRSPTSLDQSVTLTNPSLSSYLVTNLSSGTWYFSVVSVNTQGTESAPSNPASATI